MNDHSRGLLITTLGALAVVPDALFGRLIIAEPLTIAFWRVFVVGLAIGLGLLVVQGPAAYRSLAATGWNGVVYVLCTGSSGLLFMLAVNNTSVANVVFIIASMPVFAAIYSRVFLGERISTRTAVTIAAVAVGLGVITYGSTETEGAHWSGDLMALAVSALFAAGLTAARRVRPISIVPAVPVAYLGGALIVAPFADPLSVGLDQAYLVLMHGAFIVVSSVLLALGPRYITSAEVALLILLETVLAPVLVWFVLGETPGSWALIGGALVVGTLFVSNLWVLMRRRRR